MRVTVDQVTFDEFTEATVAIRRLFYAKQKRAQRRSAAVYVVAAMMGLFMFGGVFGWWSGLDYMPDIRPPAYGLALFAFPLIGLILFASITVAAQQARSLSAFVWRSMIVIVPTVAIFVFLGWMMWITDQMARPRFAALPDTPRDWYGMVAPQAGWLFFVLITSTLAVLATRRQLRQVWNALPTLTRIKQFDITSTGVSIDEGVSDRSYRWPGFVRFIETPNLLVLCPSEVTFEILPKRSFTSPDDLQTARALFASQIITPGAQPAAFPVLPAAPVATAEPDRR